MPEAEEKRIIVKVAYNYFQSGKWDRALEEYKKLVAIDPMDFLVHNMIGEIHLRKGQAEEAINAFMNAANLLHATNNYEKAIRAYKHILKLNPQHAEALAKINEIVISRLAEIDGLIARGETEEAGALCDRLLERLPDDPRLQAKMRDLETPQRPSSATFPPREASAVAPSPRSQPRADDAIKNDELVRNLFSMAEYYEQKQAWDEAVEAYITILRFQPDDELPRNKLRDLYRKITRQDKAEEVWSRISGENRRRMESIKKMAKTSPSAPSGEPVPAGSESAAGGRTPSTLAETVSEMEKLREQAEARLRRSIEERRERDKRRYEAPGDSQTPEEGREPGEESEENIQVLLTQAQMYIRQNLLVEAMRMCQRILELDPANKDVRGILKQIYDKKNL